MDDVLKKEGKRKMFLYSIAVFMVCGTLDIILSLLVKTELMAGL